MTDKKGNGGFLDNVTPENLGTLGGAMAGLGVGNIIDWYVGALLVGVAQDLVWLVAPPAGMVLGAVAGYKVVKRLTKEKDNSENGNNPVKK